MRGFLCAILFILCSFISVRVDAEEHYGFIDDTKITINGSECKDLNDNSFYTVEKIKKGETIKLTSNTLFDKVYIIYSVYAQKGELIYDNNLVLIGQDGFLHEYVELNDKTNSVELTYKNNVSIEEIYVFKDDTPRWVQKWEKPLDDADMLVFSAHNDDEQLFFAGLVPKTLNDGKKVQMVFFTVHASRPIRMDEELDSIWAYGMKNYPYMGILPDAYSTSLRGALSNMKKAKLTEEDLIKYTVDTIRRFKPEVIVTHDINGEYGHGQHRLTTSIVTKAIKLVNDADYESEYDVFSPSKVYIHLYKENPIVMDYDIPLDMYDGRTAFRVSMDAFKKHETQQYLEWAKWQYLDSAKKVPKYNPCYYGLYYSTVGYENEDNNMFYNILEPTIEKESSIAETDTDDEEKVEEVNFKIDNEISIVDTIVLIIIICLLIIDISVILIKKKNNGLHK